jgi:hypothetical protein
MVVGSGHGRLDEQRPSEPTGNIIDHAATVAQRLISNIHHMVEEARRSRWRATLRRRRARHTTFRGVADQDDVRRIARSLPDVVEAEDRFAFSVLNKGKLKGFAWVWMERVQPKKARVPQPAVVALRVANELEKQMLIAADGEKFFTEPHYNGFPAVLVRLTAVDADELEELITDAWRCQAPRALVEELDRGEPG